MDNLVTIETQVNLVSEYPKEIDEFFESKKISVKMFPTEFLDLEVELNENMFCTTGSFYNYLCTEIEFWKEEDTSGKLKMFSHVERLDNAKNYLDNAIKYYNSKNPTQGKSNLEQCINSISQGSLYSKTRMATFILNYKNESSQFLQGLKNGLIKDRNSHFNPTVAEYDGYLVASAYRNYEEKVHNAMGGNVENIKKLSEETMQKYIELNSLCVKAFHEHQQRIESISSQTNEHLNKMNEDTMAYYAERDKRCEELEKLYDEKLKLEAPAKYWTKMEEDYLKSGKKWFVASVIAAIIIILGLIILLVFIPNIFTTDTHWMDAIKNSAIITVITSIAVYILRVLVKMVMSSFHLARDAKERHNLSYFYLALIKDKAITDKERALVINALFSRSDTGLLKNESGPTMSGNVTELVETMAKK